MLLYLINPINPVVSMNKIVQNRWSKYRVWKPLGLLVIAGLTTSDWDIKVIDENLGIPDYSSLPRPDLVGITAFTSQAERAYQIAAEFRSIDVQVVMGGIHATMRLDEALKYVDSVVAGEAESIWGQLLQDFIKGDMKRVYHGDRLDMGHMPLARHDLLPEGYHFGMIQTTRGCPLNCNFCSVTTFNGGKFRRRPHENVIEEFKLIKERYVLIVDDNFIGTRAEHISEAKKLLRAMISAKLRKKWITQVTINIGEDEELLRLLGKAGCVGVFVGFETISSEGLIEIKKKFNMRQDQHEYRNYVRRIQKHGIVVVGSFIMGLDIDKKGIGKKIAQTAIFYDVDALNVLFMTPFPGTHLWKDMESQGRIVANNFPKDWKFYTLNMPVARYENLSWIEILQENRICFYMFYSYRKIIKRMLINTWRSRKPLLLLISNLSYRRNGVIFYNNDFRELDLSRGEISADSELAQSL